MKSPIKNILALMLIFILATACAPQPGIPVVDTATPAPANTLAPTPAVERPGIPTGQPDLEGIDDLQGGVVEPGGEVPADVIDAVKADLGERLGGLPEDLELVSAEMVTWNDGSLGCPEPGMMYTMALVPGYRVVLRSGEQLYDYHTAQNADNLVLCEPANSRR